MPTIRPPPLNLNHLRFLQSSEMSSSKLRSSSSFPNLLLSFLNFILFTLSAASLAPIFLLKMPPTSLGWALVMVSCLSLVSSLVAFYSQLTHMCFITHVSLLLSSLIAQVLAIFVLFTKESSSLTLLKSPRDPREAKMLVRLDCGAFMGMFMMELAVLVMTCVVHSCWVKEYQGLEADREAAAKKRSRNMARVQEESMVNAAEIAEVRAEKLDEKMKNKYGQWIKTDFEG